MLLVGALYPEFPAVVVSSRVMMNSDPYGEFRSLYRGRYFAIPACFEYVYHSALESRSKILSCMRRRPDLNPRDHIG